MAVKYDVPTARGLEQMVRDANPHRPMRVGRYEPGTELAYDVTGVAPATKAHVRLEIERFVGGGFAGQVYRAFVREVQGGPIAGLSVGEAYAVKILIPPSAGAKLFRDAIYKVGFQSPFALQVNPAAARAGALWQKLLRRGAKMRFGDERAVVDILATFVDPVLGSCGEISEWVDGRNWKFEVDDHLDVRRQWARGKPVPPEKLGSPEYCAKRQFMRDVVKLFHDMGAPELARQYCWSTCKSQPNAMKRLDREGEAAAGLTAVDFRAGLALLPFLPMSPGDVLLIGKGLARGSLVQFDRGSVRKLQAFVDAHAEQFADLRGALEELKAQDRAYRDSQIDVTHHHLRLLNPWRWGKILGGLVTSWGVRGMTDEAATGALRRCVFARTLFALVTLLPLLGLAGGAALAACCLWHWTVEPRLLAAAAALLIGVPLLGRLIQRLWGRGDYRRHYWAILTSFDYFRRAVRARVAEKALAALRKGRLGDAGARRMAEHPWRFFLHWPLSVLPAGLHRMLTDGAFARAKLAYVFVRPVRLFFNADAREQWLREMLQEGRRRGMISPDEAAYVEQRVKDPFIQKYLKSLAVHVCTLPVTQMVSVSIAIWYCIAHRLPLGEALAVGGAIIAAFQVTPISPGSLTRGLYVVYLVIRERNLRDYNIAVFLGFFKYVGYLAFPIQMAYRYPVLARFMAAHWATGAVHIVPVFGEHGALMEHAVFDLFYNRPLTLRRKIRRRADLRAKLAPRTWHVAPIAAAAMGVFAAIDWLWLRQTGAAPRMPQIWYAMLAVPLLAGSAVTLGAGGASLWRRFKAAALCGAITGLLSAVGHAAMRSLAGAGTLASLLDAESLKALGMSAGWRLFLLTILAAVGAMLTEIWSPDAKAPKATTSSPLQMM